MASMAAVVTTDESSRSLWAERCTPLIQAPQAKAPRSRSAAGPERRAATFIAA